MVGGGDLEFCVLGPVEVCDCGRNLPLGGPKQRALLADLILNAGTIVSTARLIDDLWGDAAPATAGHTVETYIARLRRVLRDGSRPEVLLTRPPGYLLDVEPGRVDALRFGQLVQDGSAAAGRGDHEEASALLRAALGLWRGQALADVAHAPFARAAVTWLADQHRLALERRIDSDLQLGRAGDLIPELEALVAAHPYHEPFHRQLMLGLYRSGRQSDALCAFRRARGLLVDELGIEPGPDLRRMEQAILRQDPGLEQPSAAHPHRAGRAEPASAVGPPGPAAASGRWRQRPRALVAAGVALAVAAAVAVPLALRAAGTGAGVPANGIGVLSPSGASVTDVLALRSAPAGLAVGGGSVWATSPAGHAVYRIDPATQAVTQAIPVGAGADGVAYGNGDVWVANALDGTVSRVDSRAGQVVQTTGAGSEPTGVAVGLGAVWVTDQLGSAVYRIDPSSGRLTRTIGLASAPYGIAAGAGSLWVTSPAGDSVERIDPVAGQPVQSVSVGADPTAIAFGFGSVWVANTLDSTVSRIDPGTGAVIETIPVGNGPAALAVASTGVWVADAAAGTAARIDPAVGRVVSSLRVGDPVLAVAVVKGVPWIGTGAGYPSGHRGGTLRVLSSSWCGTFDPAGRADWMADAPPDYQNLTVCYDPQVHVNPPPGIAYAAFNVTVPPFNDLRVRQAVSLAADRNQAVSALGGPGAAQPTCQIIPPGLPGYRPYCPFTTDPSASGTWIGPDLARARQLVAASHTAGMRVAVWAHQWDGLLGPYVVAVLRELGYRASLQVASVAAFARNINDTRRRVQASVGTWVADYPSASDFFDLFFRCSSFRTADPADTTSGSFFCHPGIDRQMSQADQLQVGNPQAAAQAWAQVDREITDLAPWVPLVSVRFADFTSARVGNYQYNPALGILLDQLWVW